MYLHVLNQPYRPREAWKLVPALVRSCLRPPRMANWLRALADRLFKRTVPNARPLYIMVEPTNHCNLNCDMCARVLYQRDRPLQHMSLAQFQRIMDAVAKHAVVVLLWNYGEPLLCPDICAMVALAAKRRLFTVITSNGLLLDDRLARDLADSGLHYLKVSTLVEKEADLARYVAIADCLAKAKINTTNPFVDFTVIAADQTPELLAHTDRLLRAHGADSVSFRRLDQHFDKRPGRWAMPRQPQHSTCRRVFTSMVINSNGEAFACCYDLKLSRPLGNLLRQHMDDVWRGGAFNRLRLEMGEQLPPMCRTCPSPRYNHDVYLTIEEIERHAAAG